MISSSFYFNRIQNVCNISNNFEFSSHVINKKRQPKILIVEDNIINQKIEILFLNHLGFKDIDVASSGKDAIEKSLTIEYSLIFLDIGLPDINGFIVCKEIRKNHPYQPIPIIAISAYNKSDIEDECMICGINEVVSKPISIEELKTVINRFLN